MNWCECPPRPAAAEVFPHVIPPRQESVEKRINTRIEIRKYESSQSHDVVGIEVDIVQYDQLICPERNVAQPKDEYDDKNDFRDFALRASDAAVGRVRRADEVEEMEQEDKVDKGRDDRRDEERDKKDGEHVIWQGALDVEAPRARVLVPPLDSNLGHEYDHG